jgi:hypothetical protein
LSTSSSSPRLHVTGRPGAKRRDLDALKYARRKIEFCEIEWKPRKADQFHTLVRSALAMLMDRRKRIFLFYMTGRDEAFPALRAPFSRMSKGRRRTHGDHIYFGINF